jgi:hypothetical protein
MLIAFRLGLWRFTLIVVTILGSWALSYHVTLLCYFLGGAL